MITKFGYQDHDETRWNYTRRCVSSIVQINETNLIADVGLEPIKSYKVDHVKLEKTILVIMIVVLLTYLCSATHML